jgi:extracellular solute-binding protein
MLSEITKPKLILTAHPPYEEVITGIAELGFSTLAEITTEPRVELVGPLAPEIQTYNVFTTAIPVGSEQRRVTGEFLRFLASDASKAVLRSRASTPIDVCAMRRRGQAIALYTFYYDFVRINQTLGTTP